MTILTRRTFLAGAAAAGALPSFALWSAAVRPRRHAPAGKQAASFYRYKVGTVEITVVSDGVNRVPDPGRLRPQRQEGGNQRRPRGRLHGEGLFTGPYNPIVINTGSQARAGRHGHRRSRL